MRKRTTVIVLSAVAAALLAGCAGTRGSVPPPSSGAASPAAAPADNAAPQAKKELTAEQINRYSYAVGVDIGRNFKREEVPLEADRLARGIRDAMGTDGAKPSFTDNEVMDALRGLKQEMNDRQTKRVHEAMRKNRADGQAYLDANEKKEGVKKTTSGLQYRVVKEGSGKSPKADDVVTVHYRGTFIDGKEFDSSYKRNEPASFPVNGVIPGWTEALQLMKEGGKSEICIPSHLAYGEQGAGNVIPPNSTLVFEVELISVKPPEAPEKDEAVMEAPAKEAPKAGK